MTRKLLFFIAVLLMTLVGVDHSAEPVQLVAANQNQTVRTVRTSFERDVRQNAGITYVVDTWVSPSEGRMVVERDTRRWHRAQTARRIL